MCCPLCYSQGLLSNLTQVSPIFHNNATFTTPVSAMTESATLRLRLFRLFEDNMQSSPLARKINLLLVALIAANVIAVNRRVRPTYRRTVCQRVCLV